MKLLLAEDEKALSDAIADILTYHKYVVEAVYNGEDAFDYAMYRDYDGVILDIMMPKRSGLDVLADLRRNGFRKPILMLTAKSQISDRIKGLDAGADDYLTKPFDMGELLARIRAMLRRREDFTPNILEFYDIQLDVENGTLSCGNKSVVLPKQEYRMMEQLMLNNSMYMSTEDLLEKAWGFNTEADINSVWLYISYLRKRLSKIGSKVDITSRRNFGYRLEKPTE